MSPPRSCRELLASMVGFDTVNAKLSGRSDPERPLALHLEAAARAMGLSTERLAVAGESFNLRVTHETANHAPHLLFVSHMDTVGGEGMTVEPFGGRIEGGRIWGRGACDTKGSGAAMLWALNEYTRQAPHGNSVSVVFTCDEEIGKTGIHALVGRHIGTFPTPPSAAIVGEPTGLHPVVAHCGCVRWTLRTHGVAAHSSDPTKGRSAISDMVRVIDALESRYIPALASSHPLVGKAQCSINKITGGVSVNVIPAECEILIDRRIVPGEDGHRIVPEVEAFLDDLRKSHPQVRMTQGAPFVDPALDPTGSEPFIAWVGAVLRALGLSGEGRGVTFSTEASDLSAAGVPTVVLGPGDIKDAHTKNESLDLAQLDKAVEVYLSIMRQPLGVAP